MNLLIAFFVAAAAFLLLKRRAKSFHNPPCPPAHYGTFALVCSLIPALTLAALWALFNDPIILNILTSSINADNPALVAETVLSYASIPDPPSHLIQHINSLQSLRSADNLLNILCVSITASAGAALAFILSKPPFHPRKANETILRGALFCSAALAVLATVGVVASLIVETARFFAHISPFQFLFGTHWSPQSTHELAFGAVPLFAGTALITLIAVAVAGVVGLLAAVYSAEYASNKARAFIKPTLEILASIPSVVYGFFAAIFVAPFIRNSAESFGIFASSESALAAGLVMGIMIIPFISSLCDDVIANVPHDVKDASLALGSTHAETILFVTLPAALPGIASAFLLAFSRAIGETMIVVMAAGLAANLTSNPLHAVTTVTAQIVSLLVGDQTFDSPKTLAAFALGFVLFIATLLLNVAAFAMTKKRRPS